MKGSEIEILHFAPFKDPIYIKMNDAHIAIRKEVARLIEVEVKVAIVDN
jgi:ferrous iron transport protein A